MTDSMDRRTFVAGAAAVAGTAALAGTATAFADAAGYIAGTYEGTGEGVGTITATVTVDDSAITEVKLDLSGETSFVGGQLAATLEPAFVEANSDQIDVIAGCTMTCYGAMHAVKEALAQAKGETLPEVPTFDAGSDTDWLGAEPEVADDQIAETWDTDILIVGAGNAGMAASLYAAQNGLNFRTIDTFNSPQDTRHWFGAVDSKLAEAAGCEPMDRKKLLSEISRYASGKCNQGVVKMWINESAELYDFVASYMEADPYNYECAFTSGEAAHWPDACNEENTVYFFPEQEHTYNGAEKARNVVFNECLENLGYSVDFNTTLVKLIAADGKVSGAIAQNVLTGDLIQINAAKGVLLACGGYGGNPYMMSQLDPESTSVITCTNASPRDRGQGIRAAVWAGAALDKEPASMLFDRGLVANGVDAGYAVNEKAFGGREFPGTLKQYNPGTQPFLKVNRNGERFANESSPYNDILYAAGNQPGGVYAQILDANYFEDITRFHTIGCSAMSQMEGMVERLLGQYEEQGLIQKADTLDELADKLGFEGDAKETFLATCERYNEIFDAQDDEDFGKPSVRLSELRTAPFYGGWLGGSLLCTMQGVSINADAQAMKADHSGPIEGLYAAGDNAGSMFAGNYPCLMPGLRCGSAMVQGIHAVKHMAGLL